MSVISPPNIIYPTHKHKFPSEYKPPEYKPPRNKVIYEYQVQPLYLSKTDKYVDSHKIKSYLDGFRWNLKQIKGSFCLNEDSFCQ